MTDSATDQGPRRGTHLQGAVGPLPHPATQRGVDARRYALALSGPCNHLIVTMLRCRCRRHRAASSAARPVPQHEWWNRRRGVSDPALESHRRPRGRPAGRSRPTCHCLMCGWGACPKCSFDPDAQTCVFPDATTLRIVSRSAVRQSSECRCRRLDLDHASRPVPSWFAS
jgi:hypothetical protein